ncbi:MAG: YbjN domain-containing protein [Saprospiraceae bacterium]|nr:YbjN domain-containing protein [Saprospiraceae bacterium]
MSWLSGWRLGKSRALDSRLLRLGRYSDAYKTSEQLSAWDRSMGHYANGAYAKSFLHFLQYLRDPVEQNIHWMQDRDGGLNFELLQGSRRINGWLGAPFCEAVTTIGVCTSMPDGLLRELLEVNDQLQFCYYGLEEDGRIILRWTSKASEADPYRLFQALRELAIQADKIDDLLVTRYEEVEPLYEPHIQEYPAAENQVRIKWLREKAAQLLNWYVEDRNLHDQYPGGMAYAILSFLYKIEFLLCPQGQLREEIETAHRAYFLESALDARTRTQRLLATVERAVARTDEELQTEFYKVVTTFGVVQPISYHRITTQIQAELNQFDAYDQGETRVYAPFITSFVIGYGLFNYALPGLIRDLYSLYYYLEEEKLLFRLGMPRLLGGDSVSKDRHVMIQTIRELQQFWSDRIQVTGLRPEHLDLSNPQFLARTYMEMMLSAEMLEK